MTEPSAAADERPAPILVTRVDVDRPLAPVSLARADGTRYTHALLIFYRGGVPVAQHSAPVTGDEITTEQLEAWVPALPADRALPRPDDAPFISVVVPTVMQRGELLERSIGALAALDYPEFEVIVVDNRPDGTAERAVLHQRLGALPGVRVVSEAYPGISAARNRGVRDARGGIVAFTDDDAVTDPNWLWAFAARFAAEPELACVTGPMLPAELETAAQVWFESSGGKLAADFRPVTYRRASEPGGR
ncbi:MAG TPA: glycosyltransferase family A protein, partial [Rugosimonospora sp.]|nr:glycosyltransferase family A protein [Rugosimonospora sp.]